MVRIIDNYILYEVIGEGEYGTVYRGVNKLNKKEYAVKVIEIKKFQKDKKLEEYTANQINILSNMEKNQHIIGYYDMIKSTNNFYFVYQYCNGGTLQDKLKQNHTIPQNQALLILKQLLQAFKVLTKYNVMHRDLKPDNIFFNDGQTKIGDFGFCKSVEKTQMTDTMLGSPLYMAPQVLRGEVYSCKADIWSIGVVLYQMLYGECPFQSSSISQLIQFLTIYDVRFPGNIQVSSATKTLLKKILTKDPKKRIEWSQLFSINISEDGKIVEQKKMPNYIPRPQKLTESAELSMEIGQIKKFKRQPNTSTYKNRLLQTVNKNQINPKSSRENNNIKKEVPSKEGEQIENLCNTTDLGYLYNLRRVKSTENSAMKFIPRTFKI